MTDAHIDFLIQHNLKSGYDFNPEDCQEFFGKATSACPNNYGHTLHSHSHNHSPPHATHLYNLDDPFYSKIRFLQTLHSPTHSHCDSDQSSTNSTSFSHNPGTSGTSTTSTTCGASGTFRNSRNSRNSSDDDHHSPGSADETSSSSARRSSRIQLRAIAAAIKSNKPSHADQDRINRMRAARAVPHQIIQTLRKEVKMDPNDSEYFDHTRPHLTSQQIHWRHFLIVDLADTKHPRGHVSGLGHGAGHSRVHFHDEQSETSPMNRQEEFVFHFPSKFWYTKDEEGKLGFLSLMKGLKREYRVKLDLATDEHDPDSDDLIVSVKTGDERTLRKVSAQIADWARTLCPN